MKEFSKEELKFLETLLRDFMLGNPRLWRSWGDNEFAREVYNHVKDFLEE